MRSLQYNEMKMIVGGAWTTEISTYYNDLDQSDKFSFALGGAFASLVCAVGLNNTLSLGIFSAYTLYTGLVYVNIF